MNFSDETVRKAAESMLNASRNNAGISNTTLDKLIPEDMHSYKREAQAALSSITLADLMPWQPIETAPKDGTQILILRGHILQVRWYKTTKEWGQRYWSIPKWFEEQPTHWMPLPACPEQK